MYLLPLRTHRIHCPLRLVQCVRCYDVGTYVWVLLLATSDLLFTCGMSPAPNSWEESTPLNNLIFLHVGIKNWLHINSYGLSGHIQNSNTMNEQKTEYKVTPILIWFSKLGVFRPRPNSTRMNDASQNPESYSKEHQNGNLHECPSDLKKDANRKHHHAKNITHMHTGVSTWKKDSQINNDSTRTCNNNRTLNHVRNIDGHIQHEKQNTKTRHS